jgi:hypothetical protein
LVTLQDGTVDPFWRRSFFIHYHSGMVMVLFFSQKMVFLFKCGIWDHSSVAFSQFNEVCYLQCFCFWWIFAFWWQKKSQCNT